MASSFRRPQLNIQPFSGDENILDEPTDFILGSNDGYLFHAHERQMRLVSGFFESALGSNPPPQMDVMKEGKRVYVMQDLSGSALWKLLILSYPRMANYESFKDLNRIIDIYTVALHNKYLFNLINPALIENILVTWIDKEPARVYAIAVYLQIRSLAERAAMAALKFPAYPDYAIPELKLITADKFHELYRYRDMCSKQCIDYLQELSRPIKYDDDQNPCMKFVWWWPGSSRSPHAQPCRMLEEDEYDDDSMRPEFWHPTEWFILHIRAVVDVVRQTMDIEKITQAMCYPNAEALVVLSQCSKCMQGAYKDLGTQAGKMAQELERRIVLLRQQIQIW